jgi:hypothetical protein
MAFTSPSAGWFIVAMVFMGSLFSCDIKKSDTDPSAEFSKIYDHPDMNLSVYPVDMEQTADGGFIILSVYTDTTLSTFPLIHVMKTGKAGELLWETWVDKAYSSAVPSLIPYGNDFYFVCMDAVNQETRIMRANTGTGDVQEFKAIPLQYPLYSMIDSNGDMLLLNFDRQRRVSILSQYNEVFAENWSLEFGIIDDVKHQIETHLAKTGKVFPFFIGQLGSSTVTHYFVNCFYNYTMTLLFVNALEGNHTGTLYTYQDDAAISSTVNIEGNLFALSRYYSGDNFINPAVTLDPSAIQSVTDFSDFALPELAPDAPVRCLHETINGTDLIIYCSQTRTNQLALYLYGAADGILKTVKFINEKYPISLVAMDFTQEQGLAILAQTYVVGRFPRVNLIKLSPEDLEM